MKRLSQTTKQKYQQALAREAMIEKLTNWLVKRSNAELVKIYRTYFRDDINSLALASLEPTIITLPNMKEKMEENRVRRIGQESCTEANQSSDQPSTS